RQILRTSCGRRLCEPSSPAVRCTRRLLPHRRNDPASCRRNSPPAFGQHTSGADRRGQRRPGTRGGARRRSDATRLHRGLRGPVGAGGLARLGDGGAWFTKAAYPYLTTLTCPGHATISTGSLPSTHGIISNQWWDRGSQQLISCTTDSTSKEVPYANRAANGGGSGRLLAVPTLASVLADAKPVAGQVVSLSL